MSGQPVPIHAHDHLPDGPDPLPPFLTFEHISVFTDTDQTIPTGTPTIIEFDEAGGSWSPSDNFEFFGNTAGAHVPATTTTERWYVYGGDCYIWAGFTVRWEDGNYPKKSNLQNIFTSGGGDGLNTPFFALTGNPALSAMGAVNPFDAAEPTEHTQHDLWLVAGITDPYFQIEVEHTAGSDRDVLYASISLVRLQAFSL